MKVLSHKNRAKANGKKKQRNELHFTIQLHNRVHIEENKKAYKRSRDKQVPDWA